MFSQEIRFSDQYQALKVHPADQTELPQAIKVLELPAPRPVVVLIGGFIQSQHAAITEQAVQVIAKVAAQTQAIVVSGGTDMGVMATIGRVRAKGKYGFPLLGITVESKVTWPGGPRARRYFWQKKQRGPLEPHHTHFILTTGDQFGDESPWIVQAATLLAGKYPAVTILVNGGKISRLDVALSLEARRPVIALAGTGRYADELAREPTQTSLLTVVPADNETKVFETIRAMLTKQRICGDDEV
jgi:hypothetical protein